HLVPNLSAASFCLPAAIPLACVCRGTAALISKLTPSLRRLTYCKKFQPMLSTGWLSRHKRAISNSILPLLLTARGHFMFTLFRRVCDLWEWNASRGPYWAEGQFLLRCSAELVISAASGLPLGDKGGRNWGAYHDGSLLHQGWIRRAAEEPVF